MLQPAHPPESTLSLCRTPPLFLRSRNISRATLVSPPMEDTSSSWFGTSQAGNTEKDQGSHDDDECLVCTVGNADVFIALLCWDANCSDSLPALNFAGDMSAEDVCMSQTLDLVF